MIPENVAIRLANQTDISAETFYKNIAQFQSTRKDEQVFNTNELASIPETVNTEHTKSTQSSVDDISSTALPKLLNIITSSSSSSPSLNSERINYRDDEDMENDADYESSGIRINWNDTTILLDEIK